VKAATIDSFWRILIPKSFRPLFKSKDALVSLNDNGTGVIVKPARSWDELQGILDKRTDPNKLLRDRETQWH